MVDVEGLSAEEREELLEQLTVVEGGARSNVVTVEVDGRSYTVDLARMASWQASDLMATMSDPQAPDAVQYSAAIKFYKLVMGENMSAVLEACGGPMAPVTDVLALMGRIIEAATPKN